MARPDYYDAPDCDTQEKGAPKFCKKSEPGEGTERSCAYDGARVVLMPITDVIHLVHGPIACAGNSWDNRGARSAAPSSTGAASPPRCCRTTSSSAARRSSTQAILELAARYPEAKAIFVYATCVTAMTGDDIEAVCKAAAKEVPIPVIPVNTPGFIGDKNIGNRLAGEMLFKYVIGTAEPADHHRLRHQPDRRVQHRRRSLGDAAALRPARHPHPLLHSAATPGSRSCATPTGRS